MIPWAALLRHAPSILGAADTLLARAKSSTSESTPQGVGERLDRLEQASGESAHLLHTIAQQVQALTLAQQRAAGHVRLAVGLAAVAVVLATCACILALLG